MIEDQRFRRWAPSDEIAVDVQIVAASNRDLAERVREGASAADLYHRLSVFGLELPALRRRRDDLHDLVPLIVAEFNAKAGKSVRVIPDAVWAALNAYDWPGNVRELRNVIERCVLFADGEVFPLQWLQLERDAAHPAADRAVLDGRISRCRSTAACRSRTWTARSSQAALERSNRNATAAARLLGTTRQTLRYRVQKYGLKSDD